MHHPLLRALWRGAVAAGVAVLLGTALTTAPAAAPLAAATTTDATQLSPVQVGAGGYVTEPPPGAELPSDITGQPVAPRVTDDFTGPAPTNDWWSSLIFQRYPDNPHGENLYAHPLSFRAGANGMALGYPDQVEIVADGLKYEYAHSTDLTVGVSGLDCPATRVADAGDWSVTAECADGDRTLRTTIGHGMPFLYAEAAGGPVQVDFAAPPEVFHEDGAVLGVTVAGHHYALFAPSGTSWDGTGTTRSVAADYVSVALLPDRDDLADFARHAYTFVTGTTVDYDYDEAGAVLRTRYGVDTEAREGEDTGTLLALYPHQWRATTTDLTDLDYVSPRGPMRVVEGDGFDTELTTHGILPSLPTVAAADEERLRQLIDEELDHPDPFRGEAGDTYWNGKALGRLAQLVPIADSIGYDAGRDALLDLVTGRMEDWLSPGGERTFYHDATWGTLIGYPSGFGSATELNDHDFHYGYFVMAAAIVARYDPAWAAEDAWGGMVRLLIDDVATTDDDDDLFPRLRSFSPYAGHGWASGHAGFAAGNNQESSSEGLHFAAATALFGAATGDEELRDLGVYLHTTQAAAVPQYWHDAEGETFPAGYDHDIAAMVWGDGADYRIWWDGQDEEHYGINYLPITAGSLYLGRDPDLAGSLYTSLVERIGGAPQMWRDIHWAHRALSDPGEALAMFEEQWPTYEPELGSSKAHTYQWLTTLAAAGRVDATVTADTAHYAVLTDGADRGYLAYNPGSQPRTVTFSDGTVLVVAPGEVLIE